MKTFFKEYGEINMPIKYHQIDTDWIDTIEQIEENVCEIKYCKLPPNLPIGYGGIGQTVLLRVYGRAIDIVRGNHLK